MDFLDPKARRNRNIRLMIGYLLVGILIITSSIILVYRAYGFDVDRKTGQVIQNALVYIDSAPDNADLYLNGVLNKSKTNARLTLPDGTYDTLIKKEKYRDWQRTFTIQGGSVERLTYPLLILTDLTSQELTDFQTNRPQITTQSPDRRWLISSKGTGVAEFTEYDLNTLDQQQVRPQERSFQIPTDIFTASQGPQVFEVVDWSNDNKHFLVKHSYDSSFEFVILNRDAPETSFNINKLLQINPTEITLQDKKFDQWYVYTADGGVLQTANVKKEIVTILQSVVAYKTHDSDTILYAQKASDTQLNVYLKQNNSTYLLKSVSPGAVKLNLARFDGAWFVAVGSDGDKRVYIYKNPYDILSREDNTRPAPISVIPLKAPLEQLSFSTNTQFIMAQAGQNIGVCDNDQNDTYNYVVPEAIDAGSKVSWMDGHRIIMHSNGTLYINDFDGSNRQKLIPALSGDTAFFDRDYTVLYALQSSTAAPQNSSLTTTDLRLKSDR